MIPAELPPLTKELFGDILERAAVVAEGLAALGDLVDAGPLSPAQQEAAAALMAEAVVIGALLDALRRWARRPRRVFGELGPLTKQRKRPRC